MSKVCAGSTRCWGDPTSTFPNRYCERCSIRCGPIKMRSRCWSRPRPPENCCGRRGSGTLLFRTPAFTRLMRSEVSVSALTPVYCCSDERVRHKPPHKSVTNHQASISPRVRSALAGARGDWFPIRLRPPRPERLQGDGKTPWRSGVKHDVSRVLELIAHEGAFWTQDGENVDIEADLVYPLAKGADVANRRTDCRQRRILVPQRAINETTDAMHSQTAPDVSLPPDSQRCVCCTEVIDLPQTRSIRNLWNRRIHVCALEGCDLWTVQAANLCRFWSSRWTPCCV